MSSLFLWAQGCPMNLTPKSVMECITKHISRTVHCFVEQRISNCGDFAKDYTISDDGLVWNFNLHDDFKFSNGEPVTAEDVSFL